MDNFMIAFLQLLVFIFFARTIAAKATAKLEQDEKAKLVDLFSDRGVYSFGALIAIMALYFASLKFNWFDPVVTYAIYIILILCFLIIVSYQSYRKLKENNYSDSYIRSYLLSTSLRFLGLIIFFLLMDF